MAQGPQYRSIFAQWTDYPNPLISELDEQSHDPRIPARMAMARSYKAGEKLIGLASASKYLRVLAVCCGVEGLNSLRRLCDGFRDRQEAGAVSQSSATITSSSTIEDDDAPPADLVEVSNPAVEVAATTTAHFVLICISCIPILSRTPTRILQY